MGAVCAARVTEQDFLSVRRSYPFRFFIPSRCLQFPSHVNFLWELLWVSSVPLERSPLWAPFNQVAAGVPKQKYSSLERQPERTCSNFCALGSCRKPQSLRTDFDVSRTPSAFSCPVSAVAFFSNALLIGSRMCSC